MPPQRRKIVPPTTTSKVRRKVAGSNRKPDVDPASPAVEPDALATSEPPLRPEPVAEVAATDETEPSGENVPAVSLEKPGEKAAPVGTAPVDEPKTVEEPESSKEPESPKEPATRTRWVSTIVVGVVALALVAFAIVAAFKPGTDLDNSAWVDQGESSEVTRQATDGLTALYRYNYETIDDDLNNARQFMSPSMQSDTDKFLDAIKSNARQSQTATDVDVMDIGVTRLESDKAELLANINVSSTRAGVAYGNAMFPIVVNMEKIDGKWVVSATQDK